jgi:hypothetical protein
MSWDELEESQERIWFIAWKGMGDIPVGYFSGQLQNRAEFQPLSGLPSVHEECAVKQSVSNRLD